MQNVHFWVIFCFSSNKKHLNLFFLLFTVYTVVHSGFTYKLCTLYEIDPEYWTWTWRYENTLRWHFFILYNVYLQTIWNLGWIVFQKRTLSRTLAQLRVKTRIFYSQFPVTKLLAAPYNTRFVSGSEIWIFQIVFSKEITWHKRG